VSTGIVFSAFRPDLGLVETVVAARDGHDVIVVDDGSGSGYEVVWSAIEESGARVLRLTENVGIAAALNAGIRAAFDGGATGVLTLDQDSTIGKGFVGALETAGDDARQRGEEVGVVVPEYFAGVSQVARRNNGVLLARHSIQSGMLIPRETADAVGLLREDLFIDLVDTEFELRLHARGLVAIAAPGLALGHSLGRRYERRLLGRRVRLPGVPDAVTLSTPFRYYYRVRNRVVINRLFARSAPGWILRDSLLEIIHFANALLLARPRRSLWALYRAGWRDGWRSRMGVMPADLAAVAATVRWDAPALD
jgi:rhamnosyltransferase